MFLAKMPNVRKDLFWYDYVRCVSFLTRFMCILLMISMGNTFHLTLHGTLICIGKNGTLSLLICRVLISPGHLSHF